MKLLLRFLIILTLSFSFVYAGEVNFSCPEEVVVDETFICTLEIFDFEGIQDVKVEIKQEGSNVARVYVGDTWKSAYYYLNEFISVGEIKNITLRVEKVEDYNGILKIRSSASSMDKFDFSLRVISEEGENLMDEEDLQEEVFLNEAKGSTQKEESQEPIVLQEEQKPIQLNEPGTQKEEIVIYESKSYKVSKILMPAFILFLLVVIIILARDKF